MDSLQMDGQTTMHYYTDPHGETQEPKEQSCLNEPHFNRVNQTST